jgi:hypothetical protein
MRERLLDATVSVLIEYGFAGTTTARVVERQGSPRVVSFITSRPRKAWWSPASITWQATGTDRHRRSPDPAPDLSGHRRLRRRSIGPIVAELTRKQ